MFFAKIPRHTSQNAITEGDVECILTRNCEGTEQLQKFYTQHHIIFVGIFIGKEDNYGKNKICNSRNK